MNFSNEKYPEWGIFSGNAVTHLGYSLFQPLSLDKFEKEEEIGKLMRSF